MEDIAFSDWPGQPVDLSGSNPWLPAYGFQTPHTLLDKDDFLGNPDGELFLHGGAPHYVYLETIQEETSDDLRSESDLSETRASPVGWLATDSESGSVIRIQTTEDGDCESDREVACPAKRRRQDPAMLHAAHSDDDAQSLSRSSSLLQFENLEKQCQDVSSSSPSIFSTFSYDSLERKGAVSPDSLERAQSDEGESDYYKTIKIDLPQKKRQLNKSHDSLFYNNSNNSEGSESGDSEETLEATRYDSSVNLKTWRSFDGLHVNANVVRTVKVSAENLSEDSGYSDNFYGTRMRSSSIPNMVVVQHEKIFPEKDRSVYKTKVQIGGDLERFRLKNCKVVGGFDAYDGDVFNGFSSNFGVSYHDLSVVDKYEAEYRSPLIDRFMRNGAAKRQQQQHQEKRADVVNIEAASECVRASKYNAPSASEPNLLASSKEEQLSVERGPSQGYGNFESNVCVSSVPKDLNLAGEAAPWRFEQREVSIAAKNCDLADLTWTFRSGDVTFATNNGESTDSSDAIRKSNGGEGNQRKHISPIDAGNCYTGDVPGEHRGVNDATKMPKLSRYHRAEYGDKITIRLKYDSSSISSASDVEAGNASFKREGSYLEAMTNSVEMSDDDSKKHPKNFDKDLLKAISEGSIQSFGKGVEDVEMFSSTPISSKHRTRNVISTPNLTAYNEDFDDVPQDPLPRKSSLINRSTSTGGVCEGDDRTLTRSFGSAGSKGVHFCPVVSEVNWRDDGASTERESSYSLSSTPEREVRPPTPPLMRGDSRKPRMSASQPELPRRPPEDSSDDSETKFVPRPMKSSVSHQEVVEKRAGQQAVIAARSCKQMQAVDVLPSSGHVASINKQQQQQKAKADNNKPVSAMEPSATHAKHPGGRLGGFFSRIASFRFSTRKNDSKNRKKTEKPTQPVTTGQRLATKDDYIYIPLKGPIAAADEGGDRRRQQPFSKVQVDGLTAADGCVRAKPPLPKVPPRVVGACVKRRQEAAAHVVERAIDSGPHRPMEPMGLIETDLDTEVTVITGGGAHAKTRSLMDLGPEAPATASGLAVPGHHQHQHHHRRPHKSMEFLLDKQNLKVVEPPENELQKGGERVMSEHQLRVQRSLQKLNVPDWYKQGQVPREGFLLKKNASTRESRWQGTGSKTTSLSSLGSNAHSPVILSPTLHAQPFVRWSTSKLNSTASSPCASTRSSFNARQPNGSISPSSLRSSFSYRQPYLGWRSQERLSRPRTPAERLANSMLSNAPPAAHPQESPEIQTSIKEVTSAIVHYVSGLRPEATGREHSYDSQETASQRSRSVSPRGSQKLYWLESSFVGTRPLDSPQTPVTLTESPTTLPVPPTSLRLDLQAHNDVGALSTAGSRKPSPSSTTLEDVLDSLLGLPSSTRAPSPSLQETASASTSPVRRQGDPAEPFRRRSEGSEPASRPPSRGRRASFHSSPILRCRYSRCGRSAAANTPEGAAFKNCHNCSYTYCSRTCRRAHWEKHRKTCLFSRVGTLCRQVIAASKEQVDTLHTLSVIARGGYLSQGLGAVKIFFPCPEAAEKFLSAGLASLGEPTYIRWPDLLPSEMGPQLYAELVKMCKNYNPDGKLVLYVSVCVVSEAPAAGAVKWERQLVSRCGKMRLSRDVQVPGRDQHQEALILTSPPIRDGPVQRLREASFANIQRHLRRRGVSLKTQYPDVYQQLCNYAEGNSHRFTPVTVYPKDSSTGKTFMCIIMPDVEPECVNKVSTAGVRVRTVNVLKDDADAYELGPS